MIKLILFILFATLGCAHCMPSDEPYIRTQPGIEYCGQMCDLFKKMDCTPYYEDVETENGGKMSCKEFCEYEMRNSVQLNPKCLVENLKECSEIETICN